MECPNCKKDGAMSVHTDLIDCHDCGEVICIDYCLCSLCNYSFRTNNGRFISGGMIEIEKLEGSVEDMIKSLEESMMQEEEYSMMGLLHTCIKCGSTLVSKSKNKYSCASCNFSWEILSNE